MKSPLRSSSVFGYRPGDYLGRNRIENIYLFCSNLHVCTSVSFLPGLEMLCHQEILPFWEIFSCGISQAPPLFFLFFFLFSYSFLCLVLEEGPDFFHSQCKTVQRTESALCESHILMSLHLQKSFGKECQWRSAGFGGLKSCVSSGISTGGDVKCTHALWTASGYSNPQFE